MNRIMFSRPSHGLSRSVVLCAAVFCICQSPILAAVLPIGPEEDKWSDMAFPTGVVGSYVAAINNLSITASPSNDLEIGDEFGPSNLGRHYGSGGTLGFGFSALLTINATILSNGSVTGGTIQIDHVNSGPGGLGADYGIGANAPLIVGNITEALLDATGDDTLDLLYVVTGGALQNINPALGTNFAPSNYGVVRIAGVTMPSTFTVPFSINGATINVFGIPEPSSFLLAAVFGVVSALNRKR